MALLLSPVPGRSFVVNGVVYNSDPVTGIISTNSAGDESALVSAGCTVVFPVPTTSNPIDVFLVAGQSNAVGDGNSAQSPLVNAANCLQYYSGALSAANDPVGNATTGSMWPAFCQTYFGGARRAICVVPSAVGSTAQEAAADTGAGNWDTGGTLVTTALANVSAALSALTTAGWTPTFVGVLWCQGEQDAEEINAGAPGCSEANYKTALYNMVKRFQTAYPNSFFYIFRTGIETASPSGGGPADNNGWQAVRNAQEDFVAQYHDASDAFVRNARMVFRGASSFASFPSTSSPMIQSDQVHWTQQGLNLAGHYGALAVLANGIEDDGIMLESSTFPNTPPAQRFRTSTLDSGNRVMVAAASGYSNGTTSTTSPGVFTGMGGGSPACSLTPLWSGRVKFRVSGLLKNTVSGALVIMMPYYGTGTAPAAGASAPGTGTALLFQPVDATIPAASGIVPFSFETEVSGLTIGTPYWFDLAIYGSSGTSNIYTVSVLIEEM